MKRQPTAGLSYIEMLVSLALLSLLTVLVSGVFDFGRRAWEQSDGLDQVTEAALLRSELRTWLEWADFLPTQSSLLDVVGDAGGFRYAGGVDHPQFPLLDQLEIVIDIRGDEIFARYHASSSLQDVMPVSNNGTLATDLADIEIQYFGRRAQGEPPTWGENWDLSLGPPRLIAVEAMRRTGTPWPPLVIYPRRLRLCLLYTSPSPRDA